MSPHKVYDLMSLAWELEGMSRINEDPTRIVRQVGIELILEVWDRELHSLCSRGVYPDMDTILDTMHNAIDRVHGDGE